MNYIKYEFENKICEVIDCNEIAIQKLKLNAGIYGQIHIYVCENCIEKFKEGN